MTNRELIKDIIPTTKGSAYVNNISFDKGKKMLESQGYHIPSLEEIAQLRILQGKDADVSKHSFWVNQAIVYLPDGRRYLTSNSPIMLSPEKAVQLEKTHKRFYLTKNQVDFALKGALRLHGSDFHIPVCSFSEDDFTTYAFGRCAKEYGSLLSNAGIKKIWIDLHENDNDKPYVAPVLFEGFGLLNNTIGQSTISGCNIGLQNTTVYGISDLAVHSDKSVFPAADLELLRKVRVGEVATKELESLIARLG